MYVKIKSEKISWNLFNQKKFICICRFGGGGMVTVERDLLN